MNLSDLKPTILRRLVKFEDSLSKVGWFEAAGKLLNQEEKTMTTLYLKALGVKHRDINVVKEWQTVQKVACRADWVPTWWQTERDLSVALTAESKAVLGDGLFHSRMTQIMSKIFDPVPREVSDILLSLDIRDEALIKSATGAATEAVHQAALGTIKVSNNNHPFLYKFQLFRAGRWPLGVYDDTFFIL